MRGVLGGAAGSKSFAGVAMGDRGAGDRGSGSAAVLVRRPAIAPAPVEQAQTGFVRIPYVVPPLPYERTEIVHMNVPVAALIAVGFRRDEPAGASVPAEILVGQDDRPLAIRILE